MKETVIQEIIKIKMLKILRLIITKFNLKVGFSTF